MNRETVKWEIANAVTLIGATIRGVIKTHGLHNYGLKVELLDGSLRNVWIECDPEGNGPGHLTIEPLNLATRDQLSAR